MLHAIAATSWITIHQDFRHYNYESYQRVLTCCMFDCRLGHEEEEEGEESEDEEDEREGEGHFHDEEGEEEEEGEGEGEGEGEDIDEDGFDEPNQMLDEVREN